MNGTIKTKLGVAIFVLAGVLILPVTSHAHGDYRGSGSVAIGYSDHGSYRSYGRYGPPYGRAYGHYAGPRCPTPYYRPYTRVYYAPRYYAPAYYGYGGGSGWDIDLRYHFSDRW